MVPSWQYKEQDREFFERELDSFLPEQIFDSHVHLGQRSDYGPKHADLMVKTPEVADKARYLSDMGWLLGQRQLRGALAIPNILEGKDIDRGNQFVAEQWPQSHALVVPPTAGSEEILAAVARTHAAAIKCYHLLCGRKQTMDADIEEYLPESMAAAAHEAGLPIIVHLVKLRALADAGNQSAINRLCRKYPGMTMVLAHAGRGYNPTHTIAGIDHVGGLDNLYFDTSCVTECGAMEAMLRVYGHERLMWGSDYPFSHLRGRCIAVNDNFTWLYDDIFDPGPHSPDPRLEFTLVGLESLRCVKYACLNCGLSDSQVEAIFCDNAAALFGQKAT